MSLRVAVASDAVGDLDPLRASVALARGWADHAQVAVAPLADGGPALGAALAALLDGDLDQTGENWTMSAGDTVALGSAGDLRTGARLAALLGKGPVRRVILDLTGCASPDDLRDDLDSCRDGLAGVELVAVAPTGEVDQKLLGLQGAVVRKGYEEGRDTATILAEETAMAQWLAGLGVRDAAGAGAVGGAGAVVLALGGRIVGGTQLCAEVAGLAGTVAAADLVVTGCTSFDVGTRGGSAVGFVAGLAEGAERPCLVFAVESTVSRREMRTFGVEAAYPVGPGSLAESLTAAARRVAEGWQAAQAG